MKTDNPKQVRTKLHSKTETRNMDDPKENLPDEDRQAATIINSERGNDNPAEDKYEPELGEWEGVDFPDYGDL